MGYGVNEFQHWSAYDNYIMHQIKDKVSLRLRVIL